MSREILREMASAISRLRRVPVDVEQVNRWAERLEENLAEIELLAAVALPDELEPAAEAAPVGRARVAARGTAGVTSDAAPPTAGGPTPSPAPTEARQPGRSGSPQAVPAGALTLTAAARLMRQGRLSPVELLEQTLGRIREAESLRAYIAVFEDRARREAQRALAGLRQGEAALLAGIPVAVKDLMHLEGYATTGGSRALDAAPSPADAEPVARLVAAGAVITGAANLHELAYGVTSENPHFGAVRNPRAPDHVAGGSSGGSAAAVAAGLALGAVGTDTGGSIRIPAAACGVAGLKPTYGRVSRQGVLPLSWSLDHVGPIAPAVADTAVLLAIMADEPSAEELAFARAVTAPAFAPGGESALSPSLEAAARLARLLALPNQEEPGLAAERLAAQAASGLKVGRPPDDWLGPLSEPVARYWQETLSALASLGASVVPVDLPPMAYIRAAQFILLQSEAAAVHRHRLHEHPNELGPDVRLRLQIGEFLMAVDYVQGQRLRRQVADAFLRLFERVDLLALPTLPVPAPPLGSRMVQAGSHTEPVHRALTRFTTPFNQSGLPALSVPVGADSQGLPVGLQLVGRPLREMDVIRAGIVVEALARARSRPTA